MTATPEIGREVVRELVWTSPTPATAVQVVGMFEPMVSEVAGEGARVLGLEADLLKPVGEGAPLTLALKLVDKGLSGRVLFGRGLGHIAGKGAFAVLKFKILLAPGEEGLTEEVKEPR